MRSIAAVVALVVGSAAVFAVAPGVSAQGGPPVSPAIGDVVPSFTTSAIDGQTREVAFPRGSKTVLLFFLSGCPTCHKMIPEWNRAFERRPKDLQVIGVLMDQEPPGFWSTVSIQFPVVRAPGRLFLQGLKVNRAPLTLRVVGGGRIEDLGLGIVDPIRLGQLFRP